MTADASRRRGDGCPYTLADDVGADMEGLGIDHLALTVEGVARTCAFDERVLGATAGTFDGGRTSTADEFDAADVDPGAPGTTDTGGGRDR